MSSKSNIILIGAGGHAQSCIDVIEQTNQYKIAGLIGTPVEIGRQVLGYDVLGDETHLHKYLNYEALLAIGGVRNLIKRIDLYKRLVGLGFNLPSIISPKAYVSKSASIGSGTIIMNGVIINAGAKIGSNCIINTGAIIDHNVEVHDHCHISTGAILNGGVSVGHGAFIGSGAVLREGVVITPSCFIRMGQTVKISE